MDLRGRESKLMASLLGIITADSASTAGDGTPPLTPTKGQGASPTKALQRVVKRLSDSEARADAVSRELASCRDALSEREREREELERRVNALEGDAESGRVAVEEARRLKDAADEREATLKREAASLKISEAGLKAKVEEAEERRGTLEEELKRRKDEVVGLKREGAVLEEALERLGESEAGLKAELSHAMNTVKARTEALDNSTTQLLALLLSVSFCRNPWHLIRFDMMKHARVSPAADS
jgi:chromosome segregation ATPase